MQEEFGDRFIPFEYHISGALSTEETAARGGWYGVSGVPAVRIDGKYAVDGARSCDQVGAEYRTRIAQRLSETGGTSPVGISGSFIPLMEEVRITATFRLLDPASLSDLHAMLILYEDEVPLIGKHWQHVVRKIVDQPVSLETPGDEVTVARAIPLGAGWDDTRLHAVAFLQQAGGDRAVIQGARLPAGDFRFDLDTAVRSIPDASGEAAFDGTVTNTGAAADTLSVFLDSGSFGGWTASVEGGAERILAPGEGSPVRIVVATDGAREVRAGTVRVSSASSGRTEARRLEVFNGSPSVLLVDDDGNRSDEGPISTALQENGILHDLWDSYHDHGQDSPLLEEMRGYDAVLWQTGFDLSTYALDRFDMSALAGYTEEGGSLFLASQTFLNGLSGTSSFVSDVLGVDSWTLDTFYDRLNGIAGDPIGDGLALHMHFDAGYQNKGDDAAPGSTATIALLASNGSRAVIRNTTAGGSRVVFMPAALHAVESADPDPDNLRTLVGRSIRWITRRTPAGATDGNGTGSGDIRIGARPNPARDQVGISFYIAQAGPVRIEIFDMGGRRIGTLLDRPLAPGTHVRTWKAPGPGVYMVRIVTDRGKISGKAIVVD